ncbi:MAG: DUF2231 domain-containing protein [Cyclobacteriaceae bacterium]
MFREISKGRMFGHPVHSMLVHFPTALYPFSLVMHLLGYYKGNPEFYLAAKYAIFGGIGMSIFAMVFGLIEAEQISNNSPRYRTALVHGGLNTLWFMGFLTITYIDTSVQNMPTILCLSSIGNIGILVSNYLGGEVRRLND